jgi:hypothetical protein
VESSPLTNVIHPTYFQRSPPIFGGVFRGGEGVSKDRLSPYGFGGVPTKPKLIEVIVVFIFD